MFEVVFVVETVRIFVLYILFCFVLFSSKVYICNLFTEKINYLILKYLMHFIFVSQLH